MASRSPTLRASSDPFNADAEKDAEYLGASGARGTSHSQVDPQTKKRRRSVQHKDDPFGDEDDGEGVKYRTLKWW